MTRYWVCVAAALLAVISGSAVAQDDNAALERAKRVLKKSILFDGHNDLPWAIRTYKAAPGDLAAYDLRRRAPGQTDLERLRLGGVGAQFWSVYVPGEAAGAARIQLEQIDLTRRLIARYPEALRLAGTAAEIRAAHRAGRIGSMLGIEGGHAIENSLGALRAYYDLGVRYMTLTHNTHTDWADSAAQEPPRWHGLNPLGEQVVLEMNRIGMLVDLSHTSAETMDDALRVSRAPVIFSHSAARALCDVPRNVPDDIVRRLRDNGGVLMITFVSGFIDENVAKVMQPAIDELNARSRDPSLTDADRQKLQEEIFGKLEMPRTSIARVADHIEHVRKVAGLENVGIGGDFDGNDLWPEGLTDVSGYPHLFAELIRRGWSDRELALLAGGNVLRALERAEDVARDLQKAAP
jgi:membrane dipeptidase